MSNPSDIKTRFLIISDTHGMEFGPETKPLKRADVAIHCGDLTEESKLDEFRASIRTIRDIDAPLKLVIPGNHDFTLDTPSFKQKAAEAGAASDRNSIVKVYGEIEEARKLFEDVRDAGIVLLDEGTHKFDLENGASLTVYASPWTPSFGSWGFQYLPERGHEFSVEKGTDVVVTHGPPKCILDYTVSRKRAGSSDLFEIVARARPRMHCFGHIHEGWGAKLVAWRDQLNDKPSHFTDIDNERSFLVEKLVGLRDSRYDTPEIKAEKQRKREHFREERCIATSHCADAANPLQAGTQTLFVNASIRGVAADYPVQPPWLIDIELPRAS